MSLRAEMQQEVMLLNMENELETRAHDTYGKSLKDLNSREIYYILLELTRNMASFSTRTNYFSCFIRFFHNMIYMTMI